MTVLTYGIGILLLGCAALTALYLIAARNWRMP